MMKKGLIFKVVFLSVLASVLAVSIYANETIDPHPQIVQADGMHPSLESVSLYGKVAEVRNGRILVNESGIHNMDVVLNITDSTVFIDAVTGMPVSRNEVTEGMSVCAYVGPAMTMSLPPITNAHVVLLNTEDAENAPVYLTAQKVDAGDDGKISITAKDGKVFANFDSNSYVYPYRVKKIVRADDIRPGSKIVVWYDNSVGEDYVSRCMLISE